MQCQGHSWGQLPEPPQMLDGCRAQPPPRLLMRWALPWTTPVAPGPARWLHARWVRTSCLPPPGAPQLLLRVWPGLFPLTWTIQNGPVVLLLLPNATALSWATVSLQFVGRRHRWLFLFRRLLLRRSKCLQCQCGTAAGTLQASPHLCQSGCRSTAPSFLL